MGRMQPFLQHLGSQSGSHTLLRNRNDYRMLRLIIVVNQPLGQASWGVSFQEAQYSSVQ